MHRIAPRLLLVVTCALPFAWSGEADARSFREAQIPNSRGCQTCHTSSVGGARNAFGQDVEASLVGTPAEIADVAWSVVCDQDSDDDGEINGAELGDPCCAWTEGEAEPLDVTSDPADGESTSGNTCDNGTAVAGPGGDGDGDGDATGDGCPGCGGASADPGLAALGGALLLGRLRRRRR